VEDRFRRPKATGLAHLPAPAARHAAWLEIILAATDLATCEIATIRDRVMHVADGITLGNPALESRPTERHRTTRHTHQQQSNPKPGQRHSATTDDGRGQNRS
jgi:hypothetical protein